MRAGRLVAELVHLQARGRTTASQLADELGVSVRTVYRDVSELQAAGVPLWTETGPGGGIHLLDGWQSRVGALTADEAGALMLAGAPDVLDELGLGALLAAAQSKLLSGLPAELRGRAARVSERFHLDAPGWFHREEPVPFLTTFATAVWEARRVDVRYRRGDGQVRRRLDPLGLVLKAGTWYVVARHRAGIRTYRVSRVAGATLRDETFERPAGFDLEGWWAASNAEFDRSLLRAEVRLRVSPHALRLLPTHLGAVAGAAALDAAEPPDHDGWRTVRVPVESEQVALSQIVALGDGVEVLSPRSLRAALRRVGQAVVDRNP